MNKIITIIVVILLVVGLWLTTDVLLWHWNNDQLTNMEVLKMFWFQLLLGILSWCGGLTLNYHRLVHYS